MKPIYYYIYYVYNKNDFFLSLLLFFRKLLSLIWLRCTSWSHRSRARRSWPCSTSWVSSPAMGSTPPVWNSKIWNLSNNFFFAWKCLFPVQLFYKCFFFSECESRNFEISADVTLINNYEKEVINWEFCIVCLIK